MSFENGALIFHNQTALPLSQKTFLKVSCHALSIGVCLAQRTWRRKPLGRHCEQKCTLHRSNCIGWLTQSIILSCSNKVEFVTLQLENVGRFITARNAESGCTCTEFTITVSAAKCECQEIDISCTCFPFHYLLLDRLVSKDSFLAVYVERVCARTGAPFMLQCEYGLRGDLAYAWPDVLTCPLLGFRS